MVHEHASDESISSLRQMANFVSRVLTTKIFVIMLFATLGFAMTIMSLMSVKVTSSTIFGESVERVVPLWFWSGIAIMIVAICYMLAHLNTRNIKIPFLVSCMMLIFSMRSVLAILSPYPPVSDTWSGIYVTESLIKYGPLSPEGMRFFEGGYARGWPLSFVLAYLITYAGVPVYLFYHWSPTIIFMLDLVVIFYLFKELAGDRIGMVSAFLFTILNTNSFFPLHYCPQTLGALFYIVAMYAIINGYKTRKTRHLAVALGAIFTVVLTHHMTTLFLGISLAGAYLSKYLLVFQQKMHEKSRLLSLNVKPGSFVRFSLPLSVFTFALWYLYGFVAYRVDATWMLTEIVRLLTTHQPRYPAGYYYYFGIQSQISQLAVIAYPAFVLAAAAIFLLTRILKRESFDGYLWLTLGWAGALTLVFILGNALYGNYIDPSRSREIITLALYPASGLFLLRIFESKSPYKKTVVTFVLVLVALFSVFSIYRGAQNNVYFDPPWWMAFFHPP